MANYFQCDIEFYTFHFRMSLESSASFSYLWLLNDLLSLLYMSLYYLLVIQIFVTCFLSENKVALHVMQLERQLPSNGHLACCLQLHVYCSCTGNIFSFIIFVLCALMSCCMFFCAHIAHFYAVFVEYFIEFVDLW